MRLQQLHLHRESYGEHEGRFTGTAVFGNYNGEIKLNLDPEASDAILRVVASQLVSSARTISAALTVDTIRATAPALENEPDLPGLLREQAQ